MSWRVVEISNRAKLDLRLNYLVVRGEETKKIHLSEISVLIIENTAVSLTAALLSELINRKIKVIFCNEKRNPTGELVPYYGSHDTSLSVRKQVGWDENMKKAVWTQIVAEKIRNQALVLKAMGKSENEKLFSYLDELAFGDETNREGHSAKVYFNSAFGSRFSRSEPCPVNGALDYGYAILLSAFSREVTAAGYITQIGLFHENRFNQFNLACDLMEPFRPLVDWEVLNMELETFEPEHKKRLVNILNSEVIIDGKKQYVNNAVKIYCKSVFDSLENGEMSSLKFFRRNFLK